VRSQYHIVKPGRYSFQFRGTWGMEKASNIIEINIKQGKLSGLESVVELLKPVLPQKWTLTRNIVTDETSKTSSSGEFIFVDLIGKPGPMGRSYGGIGVNIFINPPESYVKNYHFKAELLGQSEWGPVYMKSLKAEQLWPEYKNQIMNALGIRKD
jgi:hypothetical protein